MWARKVTGFDVARLAGVSQPTVSRSLRNLPGASPETRRRILAAASTLAYLPRDSGRVLSTRSTRRIAVVSDSLTNPYYPQLIEPIRQQLAERDLGTVLLTDSDRSEIALNMLADGSYDGVILTTTLRPSHLPRDLTERGIPHVLANRTLDHAESPTCTVDNAAGSKAISALLTELGHQNIASIQGPVQTSTGRERAVALRVGLRAAGLPLRREMVRSVPFQHDAGYAAALDLLNRLVPPTAIVCGNDVIALGALSAARDLGIDVPTALTIIGFDDIPMAGWPLINLTTVKCDLADLAAAAVDMLVAQLVDPATHFEVRRLPVQLVLRGTHAIVPARRPAVRG